MLTCILAWSSSVELVRAADVTISTQRSGANGAAGSSDFEGTQDGGSGATGYTYTGAGTVSVRAPVAGGNGGKGSDAGDGFTTVGTSGPGGDGGVGLELNGNGAAFVADTVSGGAGGAGGAGPVVGNAGRGGQGLLFISGGSATIDAAVAGGAGGTGRINGAGGTGISGSNLSLTLGGAARVSGGLGGDGSTRAYAIEFLGGTNRLELSSGAVVTGFVMANSASTFALGNTTDGTFDISGLGQQYRNFGAFEKTGSSVWTLTGTSSFSAPIRIFGGKLAVSSDGGLGASANGLTLNGGTLAATETFSSARTLSLGTSGGGLDTASGKILTQTGVVSGGGLLTKMGNGTLVLSGNNTYSGGTTISQGTVRIGSDANLGAASGSLTLNGGTLEAVADISSSRAVTIGASGGTLLVARTKTLLLSGVVSGSGGLTKSDDGTLVLVGANSFSGGTFIDAGTLQIGNGGQTGSITGDIHNDGTVVFNRADDTTFAGTILGTGVVTKRGAGKMTLTGLNTYSGHTIVEAGLLSVGTAADGGTIASSSDTSVLAGATLGGTGTVGPTRILGGTLAPGNSIGTLSVNGNLSFTATSTYAVEVSPAASDRINVFGQATLGGANVTVGFQPGTYVAKQYTIMNATAGISGTFGSKVDSNLPAGFRSSLSYNPTNVFLDLALDYSPSVTTADSGASTAKTNSTSTAPSASATPNRGLAPNQSSAANALTAYFNRNGGIPMVFGGLNALGLSQVAGEPVTALQTNTSAAVTQFMGALTDGVPGERGTLLGAGPSGFASYSSAKGKAADLPTRPATITPDPDLWRWSVWGSGFGGVQFNGADAVAGTAAVTNRINGAAVGADYRLSSETTLGFALGGGATSFNSYGLGSGSSDLFQAGLFLRREFGASYVSASAAYAWQDVTTDRTLSASDHLQGRLNANSYAARIEAGHRYSLAGLSVTPYAAAQVSLLSLPGYRETALSGSGTFALAFAGKDTTRLRSELGLRLERQFDVVGLDLTLRASAAWVANSNTGSSATATFQALPGASFLVKGAALDRSSLRTSAAAELKFGRAMTLASTFEGEFADNSHSLAGKAGLRYAW